VQPSAVEQIRSQIERHSRFVLTSHARPDGDGVGSALAGQQILRALGKHAEVVLHDPVPRNYRKLPFADAIIHAGVVEGSYDVAILLECDSLQRTRLLGLEGKILINIDHHIGGRPFAHVNWIDRRPALRPNWFTGLARGVRRPHYSGDRNLPLHWPGGRHGSFMFDAPTSIRSRWRGNLSWREPPLRRSPRTFISPIPRQKCGCSARPCPTSIARAI